MVPMAAKAPVLLPDGWQIARRQAGWYLQRRIEEGASATFWRDVAGPYTQRIAAVRMFKRREGKEPTP